MADYTDYLENVKKYHADVDEAAVKGIVRHCGIALRNRDSSLVSGSDKAELDRVRNGFMKKKLALTDSDDALDAAAVDPSVAKKTELHETKAADGGMSSTTAPEQGMGQGQSGDAHGSSTTAMGGGGMMTMAEVEKIPVAAGTTVALEPGGYHIMLMELAKPLVVGEKVKVTLTFEKAGDVVVEAEVRDNAP